MSLSVMMLLCSLNCIITSWCRPSLLVDDMIISSDTPARVWLYVSNMTNSCVEYEDEYEVQVYGNNKWSSVYGLSRYNSKQNLYVLGPYRVSRKLIKLPKCKRGLYRIVKTVLYKNESCLLSFTFFVF